MPCLAVLVAASAPQNHRARATSRDLGSSQCSTTTSHGAVVATSSSASRSEPSRPSGSMPRAMVSSARRVVRARSRAARSPGSGRARAPSRRRAAMTRVRSWAPSEARSQSAAESSRRRDASSSSTWTTIECRSRAFAAARRRTSCDRRGHRVRQRSLEHRTRRSHRRRARPARRRRRTPGLAGRAEPAAGTIAQRDPEVWCAELGARVVVSWRQGVGPYVDHVPTRSDAFRPGRRGPRPAAISTGWSTAIHDSGRSARPVELRAGPRRRQVPRRAPARRPARSARTDAPQVMPCRRARRRRRRHRRQAAPRGSRADDGRQGGDVPEADGQPLETAPNAWRPDDHHRVDRARRRAGTPCSAGRCRARDGRTPPATGRNQA